MLNSSLLLNREVEVLIIIPFRLGFDIPPTPASDRKKLFPQWADILNSRIPDYDWSCTQYNDNAPATIKSRKSVFLNGTSKNTSYLKSWVMERSKDVNWLKVSRVEENVWYYDWGLGAVDLTLTLNIEDHRNISGLNDWAFGIFNSMYFVECDEKDHKEKEEHRFRTKLFENWDRNSGILLDLVRDGGKIKDLGIGRQSYQCGWTVLIHFALIVKTTKQDGMSLNAQQVRDLMESFAGKAADKDQDFIPLPGILGSIEGTDGTVCILDSDYKSQDDDFDDIVEKVKWNYRLAILFYANLNNYIDKLADKMHSCLNSKAKSANAELHKFRNDRLQLQLFLNESSPRTVAADDATSQKIYNGVWESCMGNETVEEINYQLNYLQSYYSDSISLESSWLQTKMNYILIVLNIMVFATVIATLIGTYDIRNEAVHPSLRLLLIGIGSALFGVLSLLIIFRERRQTK